MSEREPTVETVTTEGPSIRELDTVHLAVAFAYDGREHTARATFDIEGTSAVLRDVAPAAGAEPVPWPRYGPIARLACRRVREHPQVQAVDAPALEAAIVPAPDELGAATATEEVDG